MTELLKKEIKFHWDDKCEEAFHTLRKLLTTAPVLAQPDSTKPFDVYCDASGNGLFTLSRFGDIILWVPSVTFTLTIRASNISLLKLT
jgi:hypothetical protein